MWSDDEQYQVLLNEPAMNKYEYPEFDTYPPAAPKPKVNWQKVWEKFANGFGNVAGWATVWAVVAAMVFGISVGVTGYVAGVNRYDEWAYSCRAAGNTVAVIYGDDLCLSGVRIEQPMNGWSLDEVACAKLGGIVGDIDKSSVCYIGKVESKEP